MAKQNTFSVDQGSDFEIPVQAESYDGSQSFDGWTVALIVKGDLKMDDNKAIINVPPQEVDATTGERTFEFTHDVTTNWDVGTYIGTFKVADEYGRIAYSENFVFVVTPVGYHGVGNV